MFSRNIKPVTWRPALRYAATPPGPPGCQSTSVKMGQGKNRDSDTPAERCSPTPSSSSWARRRWRPGSVLMTVLEPARLTVSAGNEQGTYDGNISFLSFLTSCAAGQITNVAMFSSFCQLPEGALDCYHGNTVGVVITC